MVDDKVGEGEGAADDERCPSLFHGHYGAPKSPCYQWLVFKAVDVFYFAALMLLTRCVDERRQPSNVTC